MASKWKPISREPEEGFYLVKYAGCEFVDSFGIAFFQKIYGWATYGHTGYIIKWTEIPEE